MSDLSRAVLVNCARKAYGLVQLRKDYPVEYQQGMDDYDRGRHGGDCPYFMGSDKSLAWFDGWRQARRDDGE